jgi:hypothetical protein
MADGESQSAGAGGGDQLSDEQLQHLVDKVYRLLQQELRLSRARGEPAPRNSSHAGSPVC